jgi:hypothetical protein
VPAPDERNRKHEDAAGASIYVGAKQPSKASPNRRRSNSPSRVGNDTIMRNHDPAIAAEAYERYRVLPKQMQTIPKHVHAPVWFP